MVAVSVGLFVWFFYVGNFVVGDVRTCFRAEEEVLLLRDYHVESPIVTLL